MAAISRLKTWIAEVLTAADLNAELNNIISWLNGAPTFNSISFPASQVASGDPNTLDDYEEGSWTPNDQSGASLTFSTALGRYIKVGSLVHVSCKITFPVTADGSNTKIGGLPFTASNAIAADLDGMHMVYSIGNSRTDNFLILHNTTNFSIFGTSGSAAANSLYSATTISLSGWYQATA